MSDVVVSVKAYLQQALQVIQDISARAPGTPQTQALLVGAVVGLLVYNLRKKRYNLPPGPRGWPLLGNIMALNDKEKGLYQTLKRWADEKYGPVITVYLGPVRCVTLNSADVITEALVHKGSDFASRPFVYSINLMTEGSKDIAFGDYNPTWKLHRKIAMQAVRHFLRGVHLEEVVHQVLPMVMDKMEAEGKPFNPNPYCSTLIFHIIHNICFGGQKSIDDPGIQRLIYIFDRVTLEIGKGLWEDVIPLLRHWPSKALRNALSLNAEFLSYLNERIEEHRKRFSPDDIRDFTDSILVAQYEAEREERAEVMAMFSDVHVRQTIADIFGAGVDTSRMTMTWAMLYLAGHPEIQKRAQKEIDAATGSRMPTAGDRPQLQYTEAVLNEVMRMSSVVPTSLPHKTLVDTTVGGYEVPKDTMVLVNLWAALHDPKIWDQPEEFRPERYLDDAGKLKGKLDAWLPFSTGRRVCLGENVARPELLLVLSCLLKRFSISLPEGHVYDHSQDISNFVFRLPKPFKIVVTPR